MLKLLAIIFILVPSIVAAQTIPNLGPGCTFSWEPNAPAENIIKYKLYLTRDGVSQLPSFILAPATSITCKDAGVTTAGLWRANVHAINNAGQESGPSNGVAFNLAIPAPMPSPPKGLRMSELVSPVSSVDNVDKIILSLILSLTTER